MGGPERENRDTENDKSLDHFRPVCRPQRLCLKSRGELVWEINHRKPKQNNRVEEKADILESPTAKLFGNPEQHEGEKRPTDGDPL